MKQGSNFKKTALALTTALGLLGLSGVASAAMYEGCVRPNVELPCEDNGWHFAAAYLLVQPTSDGLAYAQTLPTGGWDPSGQFPGVVGFLANGLAPFGTLVNSKLATGRVHEVTPGFNSSGLKLDGAYYYGNGYDFDINWTRIFQRNTGRDTAGAPLFQSPAFPNGIVPGYVPYPTSFGGVHADGSLENDEVNLEWGRRVLYGDRVVARTHFGISYARVKSTLDTRTFNFPDLRNLEIGRVPVGEFIVGPNGNNPISSEESRFNGFGPRVGGDVWYDTGWWNLSFVGHAAGALYVGQIDSKAAVRQFPFNITPNTTGIPNPGPKQDNYSTRTVVPAAKIWGGVQYNYLMQDNSILSGEIGYIWAAYFNTLRNPIVAATGSPLTALLTQPGFHGAGDIGNFGYHGLYFDLKWRTYT